MLDHAWPPPPGPPPAASPFTLASISTPSSRSTSALSAAWGRVEGEYEHSARGARGGGTSRADGPSSATRSSFSRPLPGSPLPAPSAEAHIQTSTSSGSDMQRRTTHRHLRSTEGEASSGGASAPSTPSAPHLPSYPSKRQSLRIRHLQPPLSCGSSTSISLPAASLPTPPSTPTASALRARRSLGSIMRADALIGGGHGRGKHPKERAAKAAMKSKNRKGGEENGGSDSDDDFRSGHGASKGKKGRGKGKHHGGAHNKAFGARKRVTRSQKGEVLVDAEHLEAERRAVEAEVRRLGLVNRDVKGDGNCFFRAVSDQLFGSPARHADLRRWVCERVEADRTEMEQWVLLSGPRGGWEGYLKSMRSDGTFATQVEVVHMARMIQRDIRIVKANHSDTIPWRIPSPSDSSCASSSGPDTDSEVRAPSATPDDSIPSSSTSTTEDVEEDEDDSDSGNESSGTESPHEIEPEPENENENEQTSRRSKRYPKTKHGRAERRANPLSSEPFDLSSLPAPQPDRSLLWLALYSDAEHYESIRLPERLDTDAAGAALVPDTYVQPHALDNSAPAKAERARLSATGYISSDPNSQVVEGLLRAQNPVDGSEVRQVPKPASTVGEVDDMLLDSPRSPGADTAGTEDGGGDADVDMEDDASLPLQASQTSTLSALSDEGDARHGDTSARQGTPYQMDYREPSPATSTDKSTSSTECRSPAGSATASASASSLDLSPHLRVSGKSSSRRSSLSQRSDGSSRSDRSARSRTKGASKVAGRKPYDRPPSLANGFAEDVKQDRRDSQELRRLADGVEHVHMATSGQNGADERRFSSLGLRRPSRESTTKEAHADFQSGLERLREMRSGKAEQARRRSLEGQGEDGSVFALHSDCKGARQGARAREKVEETAQGPHKKENVDQGPASAAGIGPGKGTGGKYRMEVNQGWEVWIVD